MTLAVAEALSPNNPNLDMTLAVAEGLSPNKLTNREKIAPLKTQGIIDPPTWGGHRGLVVGVFECGPTAPPRGLQ